MDGNGVYHAITGDDLRRLSRIVGVDLAFAVVFSNLVDALEFLDDQHDVLVQCRGGWIVGIPWPQRRQYDD